MTSHDPCPEGAEEQEAFALCVCSLARHLAEMVRLLNERGIK